MIHHKVSACEVRTGSGLSRERSAMAKPARSRPVHAARPDRRSAAGETSDHATSVVAYAMGALDTARHVPWAERQSRDDIETKAESSGANGRGSVTPRRMLTRERPGLSRPLEPQRNRPCVDA